MVSRTKLLSILLGVGLIAMLFVGLTITGATRSRDNATKSSSVTTNPFNGSDPSRTYSFSDSFLYANISQMVAAGWQLCGGGNPPISQYQVQQGLLTLYNNGITG